MDLQLAGKRALVTGSSTGLGAEIARRLAAEGATVIVHGRDATRTEKVAADIRSDGGKACVALGDIGTDSGADAVALSTADTAPVDILVNNAGAFEPAKGWNDASPADWAGLYNLNVIAAVRMIQRLVPAMRGRGWGRVIQISSVTGLTPAANQPHYAATNAARTNLTRSLAHDLRHSGVTSNAVAAGGILTTPVREFLTRQAPTNGWGTTWAEIEPNAVETLSPNDTGRIGRTSEYADLVAFLASPRAGYINGSTLRVDGGAYA